MSVRPWLLRGVGIAAAAVIVAQSPLASRVARATDPVLQLPVAPTTLTPFATGLAQITDLQRVPGTDRLAVTGKAGQLWLVDAAGVATPWFQVDVRTASEMGLLGIAFAPDFPSTGHFYLHTNPADGDARSQISRWKADPTSLLAPERRGTVLEVAQPFANHDGGQLRFGPDGFLYIALGDGGSAGDPHHNGQDTATLLGAILRIDVAADPYTIPASNPLVSVAGARPELYAWGLRNPWRFDFLPDGRLVIGDVGQNAVEEVTVGGAGANHGWNVWEGDRCYEPAKGCSPEGYVAPVFTYSHKVGQSITGGVVVSRGPHAGRFLFGDFVSGELFTWDPATGQAARLGKHRLMPSAFGHDAAGNPLVADFQGTIYRVE